MVKSEVKMRAVKRFNANSKILRLSSHREKEYKISDELRKDLADIKAGRDLIGPFNNLSDLWRELEI